MPHHDGIRQLYDAMIPWTQLRRQPQPLVAVTDLFSRLSDLAGHSTADIRAAENDYYTERRSGASDLMRKIDTVWIVHWYIFAVPEFIPKTEPSFFMMSRPSATDPAQQHGHGLYLSKRRVRARFSVRPISHSDPLMTPCRNSTTCAEGTAGGKCKEFTSVQNLWLAAG
jgi:hypothetical protein